ncbi:hypothetical protein C2G38_1137863 [Gigaspora rosea]|uniref:SbsA Ig-like domain-containing protein n=1 Tax=Gigaspora rosea TaxID=44941 RepID=A0A397VMC2_9GLOM|nr:hypothetical protein C2G38_1137863 [Gigaspora rosea]
MKLFNLSYNLITQCLFLISLCAFITSTKSELTFFNHTETTLNDTNVSHNIPFVINLDTYDDGTALVHITRRDPELTANCTNYLRIPAFGLEQIFRIRVIQLNGTVIEINLDLKLDPPNYCYGKWKPVNINALQKQFFLVTYLNATNSSDPTTYEEWGSVIDWNGNIKSKVRFGLSFVQFNLWSPKAVIHLNVNSKLGFLRLAFEGTASSYSYGWQQYNVDDSGVVTMLKNDKIPTNKSGISITSTVMATIDGGYAIIYANSTIETNNINNSFVIRGRVYADFISYNLTKEERTILLYTLNDNVNFTGIYCDLVSVGVGQVCTITTDFINFNNNGTANNITNRYIRINFLSSGSLLKVDEPSNLPNKTVPSKGWQATSMSFGGYVLHARDARDISTYYIYAYDQYGNPTDLVSTLSSNQTVPTNNFTTNTYGAYTIMKNNNTFLLPTLDTNIQNTSWSLHTITLPKVLEYKDHNFGNLEINQVFPSINGSVDSSFATINITFFDPVMLSTDPHPGYVTIYKASDPINFRQKIPPTSDFCQISSDGKTININILTSTFNEYNQGYYVRMDNNFVKSRIYQEPLNGINDGIWKLISDNKNNLIASYNSSGTYYLIFVHRFISSYNLKPFHIHFFYRICYGWYS